MEKAFVVMEGVEAPRPSNVKRAILVTSTVELATFHLAVRTAVDKHDRFRKQGLESVNDTDLTISTIHFLPFHPSIHPSIHPSLLHTGHDVYRNG